MYTGETSGKINATDIMKTATGQVVETITGSPEQFEVHRLCDHIDYWGYGGHGAKPSGMICVDGILYYAVQNLLGRKTPPNRLLSQHGSVAIIIMAKNYGKTWTPELNLLLNRFMTQYS